MNVYDFDNTIYDGESTVDFYMFCLRRNIKLIKLLPMLMIKMLKYKLCLISIDELEKYVVKYSKKLIEAVPDPEKTAQEFWEKNFYKIKPFYLSQKKPDDIILSASFEFLLKIPATRLGVQKLICSQFDNDKGELIRVCFRNNKVPLLKEYIGDESVCFYTDSMNDKPVIDIADEAYLVKGDIIKKIK